jgi:HlyD family secretion protein
MKMKTWVLIGAGMALMLALFAWAFAPRPVEVEVATASQGAFETTVDEDGKTRLRDRYVVSAPLAGELTRVDLREGDTVAAGDVVAVMLPALSPMLDERSLREQQVRVRTAEAQVQRAATRIESAAVALQQAKNDVKHSEQLAGQGFVSLTKLDNDRLAALAAQKDLDTAVQDRRVAEHEVAQAQAALLAVRRTDPGASRSFALRSPVAGRVLRVAQTSETVVPLGTPLLELGDTRQLEIVAELLTTDALQTHPGSRVVIERWGGRGALEGRVRLVEPSAFTKVSALGVEEQRVKVVIAITSPPADWAALGDGYRVGVRIVTLSMATAVKVPVSAVFPVAQGEGEGGSGMAVFCVEDGRARLRPVKVGARNGSHAWVQQGLQPGTTVVVYPPASVKDGVRVSARTV